RGDARGRRVPRSAVAQGTDTRLDDVRRRRTIRLTDFRMNHTEPLRLEAPGGGGNFERGLDAERFHAGRKSERVARDGCGCVRHGSSLPVLATPRRAVCGETRTPVAGCAAGE